MIKNFLTRFHPHYPTALIYMLQASEYNIKDYFIWFHHTRNFCNVEKRKKLKKTPKAILLIVFSWTIIFLLTVASLYVLASNFPLKYFISFAIIAAYPFVLAYSISILLLFFHAILQYPAEYLITVKAKKRLENHKAIKIAIAGSYGKTTIREIIKDVLSVSKKVGAPPNSHNTPMGISKFIDSLKGDEEVLIFELGEYYPGDIKKLCELIKPNIGIITGINEAHLEKFRSIEKTIRTIFELSDYIENGSLYINGENKLAKSQAKREDILYDRNGTGRWTVVNPKTNLSGTSLDLVGTETRFTANSKLLGLHQIGPLSVAAEISSRLGLTPDAIRRGLNNTKPFKHRLELKNDGNGVITLDDSYNGNPDGVNAVIDFLSGVRNHRRFYVTPGLVEIGHSKDEVHKKIGEKLSLAKIEKIILIKNSVTPFIELGLKRSNYQGEILWFNNSLDAFNALPHLTVKNDIVLIQNDWPDQYR